MTMQSYRDGLAQMFNGCLSQILDS